MTEVRRADRGARHRRRARRDSANRWLRALRQALRDWLLSEPGELGYRVRLVFFLFAAVLSVPLVAFAVYLWSLGAKVLRARQFPPPEYRVIRDTPVIGGQAAVLRGRGLKVLAVCLGVASVLLWLLLGRLAWVLSDLVTFL